MKKFYFYLVTGLLLLSFDESSAKSRCPVRYIKNFAELELQKREPQFGFVLSDFAFHSRLKEYSHNVVSTQGYSFGYSNIRGHEVDVFTFKASVSTQVRVYSLYVHSETCSLKNLIYMGLENEGPRSQ